MFPSRYILGNIHQGTLATLGLSRSLGTQCTAIALVALLFASLRMPPNSWSRDHLDSIVFEGDGLYHRIIDSSYNGDSSVMLSHDDIPQETHIFDAEYRISFHSTVYGIVERSTNNIHGIVNLQDGLNNGFLMSNSILGTFGSRSGSSGSSIAVFRDRNIYYVFDSHSRNRFGEVDPTGASVLLQFSSRNNLLDYLTRMYSGHVFNLSPVTFHNTGTLSFATSDSFYMSDHQYNSMNEIMKRKEKRKGKNVDNVDIDILLTNNRSAIVQNEEEILQGNVACYSEVYSMDSTGTQYCENESELQQKESMHCVDYEEFIRRTPTFSCVSCLRFLFKNQTNFLSEKKLNNLTQVLDITTSSSLCCTCKKYLADKKIPNICAKLNALHVNQIPNELDCLNTLEKKLLSKIQTFFTLIILPGGQYAEKGMVLNLPRNVSATMHSVASVPDLNQMCVVRFENSDPVGHSPRFLISPAKLITAFRWLKEHNRIYANLTIPTMQHVQSQSNFSVPDVLNSVQENGMCTLDSLEQVTLTEVDGTSTIEVADCLPTRSPEGSGQSITIPRIHSDPVSIYDIPDGEESAFPWLFPEGKFGFTHPRMQKLNPSMYFRTRLYNELGIWRKDVSYLLHAAVAYDTMLLKQEINIYMKMCKKNNEQAGDVSLTAGDIRSYGDNPEVVRNSYMFMKNIRGTVAYFRNALYDLLAMFRTLGPPTLFVTLSADDLHWPELGMALENLSYDDAVSKGSFFSSMRADPLMTAIHFERRLSALLKFVLHSESKPLGKINDYFIRTEFQLRGSPHYHMFFWIDGLCEFSFESDERNTAILQYIDQTVKTIIPDESEDKELHDLVTKLQTHVHTSYCMPSKKPPCRFGFPKRECKETHLLSLVQSMKNKGKFYETKRTCDSVFINAYNPTILRHWRANMDIQVINNAEGAAYYVCHYLCKSEPDELKCALSNLIQTVFKQNPSLSVYQRLWKIGTCVLKHRRMSAQEAAFRLSNLKLLQNTRTVVYLNTRPLNKRYKMLKPIQELNLLPDNSTDIFMTNIVDYYYARPQSMQFMCLYEFAAWYIKCPRPSQGRVTSRMNERIYIPVHDIWMRKRKHAAVVRYPAFSISCDDYYYSLLMLMLPHKEETELLGGFINAKDAFMAKYSLLDTSMQTHNNFMVQVESAIRRIRLAEAELNEQSENIVDPNIHNFDTASAMFNVEANSFHDIQQKDASNPDDDQVHFHEINGCRMTQSEYDTNYVRLTQNQKKVINYIHQFFLDRREQSGMRLFVTGGGGVGKSHVLKMIAAYLDLRTAIISGTSPVKCVAPTGTAARNIRGSTLHSLLKIPVEKYLNYAALSAYQLQQLRAVFAGVHTLIVDEVSMVSDRMFTFISRRLSEISGSSEPFGNYNIILFGDFFQLPPVRGQFVFHNRLLWNLFQPVFLRENVRQAGDTEYAALLNRARVGMLSHTDIEYLKTRLVNVPSSHDTLSVYPTRAAVHMRNAQCACELPGDMYEINAEHFFSQADRESGLACSEHYIPEDDRDAGNLPNILRLKLQSRVMLIRNILTEHGLVNGALGTVTAIDVDPNSNEVTCIYVLFDDPTVGSSTGTNSSSLSHEPIAILPFEHVYYMFGRSIVRKTFPIIPAWACTIHKVQGMTLCKICIDLGSSVFQDGMAYVALSRVKNSEGLFITALSPSVIKASDEVLEEYDKLRKRQL